MHLKQYKRRVSVKSDRLSSLPDDLIHKIFSFIGLKRAIETSVLSSRWRFIWTSMPYLDFSIKDFSALPKFVNYVTNVLSHRNNLVEVISINLHFSGDVSLEFVKRILDYATSHNIQRLNVVCVLDNNSFELPLSLFSSRSLKHLSLRSKNSVSSRVLTTTSTWELPALTTLYLRYVTLCDDHTDKRSGLFSKCANLKNLTLYYCQTKGLMKTLSICHPQLSNLTLRNDYGHWQVFDVFTPQLKNLNISHLSLEHYLVSAPKLASLVYSGLYPLHLSTDGFPSLEKVDLDVFCVQYVDAHIIVSLFQQLQSVRFLTLRRNIVELLSSSVELMSHQPLPFANLKSLKIIEL